MSVTVGFAPATMPGLVTGGTSAAPDEGAPEGLFATLLAMLAPTDIAKAEATVTAAGEVSAADFTALIQSLVPGAKAPPAPVRTREPAEDAEPPPSPSGDLSAATDDTPAEPTQKPPLKELGDALLALRDALDTGRPIDPALEKKLAEAIDAIAVAFGLVLTPEAPVTHSRITALATGAGVLPAPASPPAPTEPPLPAATPIDDAPVAGPAPPSLSPLDGRDAARSTTVSAPVMPAGSPAASDDATAITPVENTPDRPASSTADIAPAMRQLAPLIDKLADRLQPQDPALASKLAALAESLRPAATPVTQTTADAEAGNLDPDLQRIIDALEAPRPTTRPTAAPQFATPALELPELASLGRNASPPNDAEIAAPGAAAQKPASESVRLDPAPVAVARPKSAASPDREATPVEKPAPQVAPAPAADGTSPAGPTSAPASQPAAVPAARTVHAAYQAPVHQLNLPQVAFEVVRHFDAGNSRFQIRLDPAELGRIDVRLEVDKAGTVNARMVVERPETLDLMQRDQRALQQALQQAGLDASRTNLEFSLRQNPFAAQGGMGEGQGRQPGNTDGGGGIGNDDTAAETATTIYRGSASAGGVNLFA